MRRPTIVLRLASASAMLVFGCDGRQPLEPSDVAPHALATHVGTTEITAFHAEVKGPLTHWGENRSATLPYWPVCANGAFVCANATITEFGKAQYSFNVDSFAPTGQFAGMTGNGTDTFLSAGANTIASYAGVLAN